MELLPAEPEQQMEGILPETKKIKKILIKVIKPLKVCKDEPIKLVPMKEEGLRIGNSYDTYSQSDRNNILRAIKELVIREVKAPYDTNETMRNGKVNWVQILIELGHDAFNGFIREILPRYRPQMSLTKSKLTQLRKQIRYWLKSEGIPETRGCALIREDELPEFLVILEETIRGMAVRSFRELRVRILPVIEEIHKKGEREFRDNVFSKHYWSDFKTKHPRVKQLWKSLPGIKSKETGFREDHEMEIEKPAPFSDNKAEKDQIKHEHNDTTLPNPFAGMKNWTTMLNLPSIMPKFDLPTMGGFGSSNPFSVFSSIASAGGFGSLGQAFNPLANIPKPKVIEKEANASPVKHEDDGTNSSVKIEHVKDEPLTLPPQHTPVSAPKTSEADMEYMNSLATMMRTFDNMSAYIRFLLLSKIQGTGQSLPN